MFLWLLAALFRFVARFARVRIEDSSGNRFASTAYFAKPGFVGNVPSGNNRGGTFRGEFAGGEYTGHRNNNGKLKGMSKFRSTRGCGLIGAVGKF